MFVIVWFVWVFLFNIPIYLHQTQLFSIWFNDDDDDDDDDDEDDAGDDDGDDDHDTVALEWSLVPPFSTKFLVPFSTRSGREVSRRKFQYSREVGGVEQDVWHCKSDLRGRSTILRDPNVLGWLGDFESFQTNVAWNQQCWVKRWWVLLYNFLISEGCDPKLQRFFFCSSTLIETHSGNLHEIAWERVSWHFFFFSPVAASASRFFIQLGASQVCDPPHWQCGHLVARQWRPTFGGVQSKRFQSWFTSGVTKWPSGSARKFPTKNQLTSVNHKKSMTLEPTSSTVGKHVF